MERKTLSAGWIKGFVAVLTLLWMAPALADEPTRRALLIGIDDYQAVTDLRGAVNDVELIRDILIGKFDVPAENISTLTNADATRVNIIQSIEDNLIAPAREGDVVILHFSGHGSQMRDQPDGDEVDGWDETIVPHDSRTNGVFDISDDEINGLLQLLTRKTKHVTFILDSCHSGAAARAGNQVRKVDRDERTPPDSPDFAISVRGSEGDAGIRLNGADYVLISGCRAPELSNETLFGDQRHGAMTWFLADALRAAQPGATYRSIMDSVRTNVTSRFPSQHPQIEGPGMDLNFFGVDRINSAPYVLVQEVDNRVVTLDGGKLMGLRADSEYSFFPPGTTDPDARAADGVLRIIAMEDFSAQAELVSGSMPTSSARVFIGPTTFSQLPTTVFVSPDLSNAVNISSALTSLPIVDLVPTAADAQLIIEPGLAGTAIRTGDHSLASTSIDTAAANFQDRVVERVKDIVHWRALRDLQNPNTMLQVSFDLAIKDNSPARLNPDTVAPGQRLVYRVQNREQDIPLYNYVLDISSDGSVALLYPPAGEQQALAPGATLSREIEMFVPSGSPAVTDVLKVISTRSPIDPSVFPQGALRNASMPTGARATTDPLSSFLANAMRGRRGAAPVNDATWTTTQREVIVRRARASLSGFTLHFSEPPAPDALPSAIGVTRNICDPDGQSAQSDCMALRAVNDDSTLVEVIPQQGLRADDAFRSVGSLFDEAYAIQEQTGASRVEPVLEAEAPGLTDNRGIDKRELLGDDGHDPLAENDDRWSLAMIQVESAWQKIRDKHQTDVGQEARGIRIAHTDTGYLPHPENWAEVEGIRPIDPAAGHDYYDNDDDPVDPLINSSKLDNPGHGTASGSVIVSPPGCQLEGTQGCVNGVAPGAQLLPLRVNKTVSQFDTRNLAHAIRDVARGNIPGNPPLISTAMGGPPTLNLYRAVKEAEQSGVLMIAAAGNYVRTVVWPARFDATIAVAAVNVRCEPWKHSSRGGKVDISAPGESVWRASLNKDGEYINYMGKGTTFATGNTAAAAALWLSWHRNNPVLTELRAQGLTTTAFREALVASAWTPSSVEDRPTGTQCNDVHWNSRQFGPGIINIDKLLEVPLETPGTRSIPPADLALIPLFASLYPDDAVPEKILQDYRSLLGADASVPIDILDDQETEVLYHYTMDEDVQLTIDGIVSGQRSAEPLLRARSALSNVDVSRRLYERLQNGAM